MGSWTILTFDVSNPEERIEQLESWFLPSDDVIADSSGVIGFRTDRSYASYYSVPDEPDAADDTTETDADENTTESENQSGLENLFSDQRGPKSGKRRIGSNDIAVFGPIMNAVLQPGEYGAVVGVSNTSDMAGGHVYTKDSDGMVSIAGSVSDETNGDIGDVLSRKCESEFGFSPFIYIQTIKDRQ